MKLNKRSFGIIGLTFVFVAVSVAIGISFASCGQKLINILTAEGTYISLVAFGVMLQQFKSVRKTTENVKQEVNKIASIADISQYAERVRSVYDDICSQEYKLATFKLKTVHQAILSIKSKNNDIKNNRQYSRILGIIAETISTLQDINLNSDNLDYEQIQKDLEAIATFLLTEKCEMLK